MDIVDAARAWPLLQGDQQRLQRPFLTLGYYLDVAIAKVADQPDDMQPARLLRHEMTKTDTLHVALNHDVQALALALMFGHCHSATFTGCPVLADSLHASVTARVLTASA